jgi:hypothetical protein
VTIARGCAVQTESRRTSSYLTEALRRPPRLLDRLTPQPSSLTRVATLLAALVSALVAATGAGAAPSCADAILADWLDNSRIDRVYALPCYEAAIDAIPQDLEDYTDAADVIANAFQRVAGRRLEERTPQGPVAPVPPAATPPVDASSSTSVPVPILVLGGMSLTLLAAGGFGYVARRRREQRVDD